MVLAGKALVGMLMAVHPFFISMTEIKYNKAQQMLQVSVRIFTDDFEKTLGGQCQCIVDLNSKTKNDITDKIITGYITSHLQILVDGKKANLLFVGRQPEEGSTWNYFEIKNVSAIGTLTVNNTLLYDYKKEQINMVHIKVGEKDKTDKLEYPERLLSF